MRAICANRRARFDYSIEATLMAGLELTGTEVKSAKRGNASLKGAYVTIKNDEAFLTNAHIGPYQRAEEHDPTRPRRLLLHRKQINELIGLKTDGRVAVPLAMGIERGLIKLEIGLGRGKKRFDKRAGIKHRDVERETGRRFKN
jgi:SsrA-binding protein